MFKKRRVIVDAEPVDLEKAMRAFEAGGTGYNGYMAHWARDFGPGLMEEVRRAREKSVLT